MGQEEKYRRLELVGESGREEEEGLEEKESVGGREESTYWQRLNSDLYSEYSLSTRSVFSCFLLSAWGGIPASSSSVPTQYTLSTHSVFTQYSLLQRAGRRGWSRISSQTRAAPPESRW